MKRILAVAVAVCTIAAAAFAGDGTIRRAVRPASNRYIVKLYDHLLPAEVRQAAQQLSHDHGGTVLRVWDAVVPSFAIEANENVARAISRSPRVEWVEEDATGVISPFQSNAPWHLDRLDQRALPLNGTFDWGCQSASTAVAWVLDSGVRGTHYEFHRSSTDFTSRVEAGYNSTLLPGYPANNPCTITAQGTPCGDPSCPGGGHGTAVASIIAGLTYGFVKDATIVPVRVVNCLGVPSASATNDGLSWIYNDIPNRTINNIVLGVVNFSAGFPVNLGDPATTTELWFKSVVDRGATVVVSAENLNDDARKWSPARMARGNAGDASGMGGYVITVGASGLTDPNNPMASAQADGRWKCNPGNWFESTECTNNPGSNWGVAVDIFAPGQNVASAAISQLVNGFWVDSDTQQRQALLSGTSFAAPLVTGYAVRALSTGQAGTPTGVWQSILSQASGDALGGSTPPAVMQDIDGPNTGILSGSPNRLLYRAAGRCRAF